MELLTPLDVLAAVLVYPGALTLWVIAQLARRGPMVAPVRPAVGSPPLAAACAVGLASMAPLARTPLFGGGSVSAGLSGDVIVAAVFGVAAVLAGGAGSSWRGRLAMVAVALGVAGLVIVAGTSSWRLIVILPGSPLSPLRPLVAVSLLLAAAALNGSSDIARVMTMAALTLAAISLIAPTGGAPAAGLTLLIALALTAAMLRLSCLPRLVTPVLALLAGVAALVAAAIAIAAGG